MTIVWNHANAEGNENGVAWASSGNSTGTHAVSGGGFAESEVGSESTDTFGNNASGMVPIVASFPEHDSGTNTTTWRMGFSVPEGQQVRVHVVCVTD